MATDRLRTVRSLVATSVLGGCTVTLALPAAAQTQPQQGFALDRFEPSERGSEWFSQDSLDLRGHLRPAVGVLGAWSYNPLVVYDRDGNYHSSLIEHQVFVHAGGSLVLWDRLRASVNMPVAVYQAGDAITIGPQSYEPPRTAAGDLRLALDVRLFGEHGGPVTGALGAAVHFPTGSRDDYTSDGNVRFTPRATVAGDISFFTYSARVGWNYRALTERFDRNPLGSELTMGVAAGLRLANRKLVVGPEFYGSSVLDEDSFLKRRSTPIEWLLGAHYTISDFRIGGGVGTGLTRGWGSPALRALLSVEWTPGHVKDTDADGVEDSEDACPTTPGVRSSDPKRNGCPPEVKPEAPPDRDGDGIPDTRDACPELPGVENADPAKNGCPPDRDGDGVFDQDDACPDIAGERNPDPGKNGCPPDKDGDGIFDDDDACPEIAGEKSDDPTRNGCPSDKDGDGIYDKEDACPDDPGPADPDPKRNGCPLARIEDGQIKIFEQVKFKFGSAEIMRDSDPTLIAVATTLKAHPEITKVRVEGHTDNKGSVAANDALSQRRAEAVVKWLASFGIERKRLEAKGLGMRQPLDTNETEEGRQNNRRVEFHIASQSAPLNTPETAPGTSGATNTTPPGAQDAASATPSPPDGTNKADVTPTPSDATPNTPNAPSPSP